MRVKLGIEITAIATICLFMSFDVSGQRKRKQTTIPPCEVAVSDSPRFRGFHLGQSVKEISQILPSFSSVYDDVKAHVSYGRSGSDFRIVHAFDLKEDFDKTEQFRDVSFTWQFLDGLLIRLFVSYEEYEPGNLTNFVNQVSTTTRLPLKSFRIIDKHKAVISCQGFTVEANEGEYTKVGWFPTPSKIVLEDVEAFRLLDLKDREQKRKLREEAKRQKEEERRRKRIFRP